MRHSNGASTISLLALSPFFPLEPKTLPATPATKQGKGKSKSKSKAIQQKLPCFLIPHQPSKQASKPTNHEETPNRQNQTQTQTQTLHHSSFIIKKSHNNNANHPHQTLATRFPQPTPLRLRRSFLSLIEDFGRVSIATTRTATTTTTIRTARATTGRENLM